jgi:glycosyltransferase involved in cell wall biosynthesis
MMQRRNSPFPQAPMRVLMTADAVGGVWDYALELARGLARSGVMTTLATMGPHPSEAQKSAARTVPGLDLRTSEFRLEWMAEPEADLERAADWLLRLETELRPDLIHLNGYAHALLPWQAPMIVVAHSCVQSWWRAVHGTAAPAEWDTYTRRVAAGLAAADRVVTPTRSLLASLETIYRPLPRSVVIPNGRDPPAWPAQTKDRLILTAGRLWDEAKNIRALDAAAHELDWPVVAAGDWRRPDGRGATPAYLQCLGRLEPEEMAVCYGRAAIYALPARYEPFGLSVLEAAQAGCALVLGDIPSLRELWDGAAEFVPPGDSDRLAQVLRDLIAAPERRQALSEAAGLRARRYGAADMTAHYLDLYAGLIDGPVVSAATNC